MGESFQRIMFEMPPEEVMIRIEWILGNRVSTKQYPPTIIVLVDERVFYFYLYGRRRKSISGWKKEEVKKKKKKKKLFLPSRI